MSGERGRKMESSAGKMFLAAVRAPSESRRCWLKINSAARVGPDSCARTANMDAHQVLLAGRCGCSRWELVGRAGGSGRGKGAEEGEEEKEERPGAQPEGRGLPGSSRPPLPYSPDRGARREAWGARVLPAKRRVSEVYRALHTSPSPSPKKVL